jgi:hypothetical protein
MAKKPRNYKTEYRRRKLKKHGVEPEAVIREKHRKGYKATERSRKRGLRKIGAFDLLSPDVDLGDEDEFIEALKAVGFTEREAYSLFKSP